MAIYWSYAGRGRRAALLVIEDDTEVAARICALTPFLPA